MNSIGRFVKDTGDLMKHNSRYMKSHWKGVIVLNVAIIGGMIIAEKGYEARYYKKKAQECIRQTKEEKHVDVEYEVE